MHKFIVGGELPVSPMLLHPEGTTLQHGIPEPGCFIYTKFTILLWALYWVSHLPTGYHPVLMMVALQQLLEAADANPLTSVFFLVILVIIHWSFCMISRKILSPSERSLQCFDSVKLSEGWRDGPAANSASCSWRASKFSSQHRHHTTHDHMYILLQEIWHPLLSSVVPVHVYLYTYA